jgi:hypothetical protein
VQKIIAAMGTVSAQTSDGVAVYLDSFYMYDTYSGVLEGMPTPEDMISSAQNRLTRIWGDNRPVLLVQPTLKDVSGTMPPAMLQRYQQVHNGAVPQKLPHRCMMAWLSSYTVPDGSDAHGSHAFVIWFADADSTNPLADALAAVDANGGWWKNANVWWI